MKPWELQACRKMRPGGQNDLVGGCGWGAWDAGFQEKGMRDGTATSQLALLGPGRKGLEF